MEKINSFMVYHAHVALNKALDFKDYQEIMETCPGFRILKDDPCSSRLFRGGIWVCQRPYGHSGLHAEFCYSGDAFFEAVKKRQNIPDEFKESGVVLLGVWI